MLIMLSGDVMAARITRKKSVFQSIVALLYAMLVLQSNWVQPKYYKFPNRTTAVMRQNMNSFVYCNIIGPLQETTIVQVILCLVDQIYFE